MGHAKAPGGQAEGRQRSGANPTQPHGTLSPAGPQAPSDPIRFYNARGQVIGEATDGLLRKRVRASRHFLRQPPAICWDVRVLLEARHLGVGATEVTDIESGRVYRASLSLFWVKAVAVDRGHGRQLALPLGYWAVTGVDSPSPQLTLWGAA